MDKLDTYLGIIIDKIELALNKLATVERTKSTKFESMNKILDAIIDENDESKFLKFLTNKSKFFSIPCVL